ncbi:MAG: DUF262 domain-containing protein [Candidatus Riflebacteria bacterium]|nr:DUF262 domain-containing protein [Candidatus Riflebacteria bacterium]
MKDDTPTQERPIIRDSQGISLRNLLEKPLSIPPYQRAYTWKTKNVERLLDDLQEHKRKPSSQNKYVMGTIIVHEVKDVLELVDGQQRLTTLSMILYRLGHYNKTDRKPMLRGKFGHQDSLKNLRANWECIKRNVEDGNPDFLAYLLDNLYFVLIYAPNQNAAFAFFDSQNTRGKPLCAVDLLKPHHLRHIEKAYADNGNEKEITQKKMVEIWEKNNALHKQKKGAIALEALVLERLYPLRRMCRAKNIFSHNFDRRNLSKEEIRLIREDFEAISAPSNVLSLAKDMLPADVCKMTTQNGAPFFWIAATTRVTQYPFGVCSTVPGGVGFFLYIDKYFSLYQELFFKNDLGMWTFSLMGDIQEHFYPEANFKLKAAWECAVLLAYDRFGRDKINDLALWLFHLVFFERAYRTHIRKLLLITGEEGYNPFFDILTCSTADDLLKVISREMKQRYFSAEKEKELRGSLSSSNFFQPQKYVKSLKEFLLRNEEKLKGIMDIYLLNGQADSLSKLVIKGNS